MGQKQYVCPDCETVHQPSGRRPGTCRVCGEPRYFRLADPEGTVDDERGRSSPPPGW